MPTKINTRLALSITQKQKKDIAIIKKMIKKIQLKIEKMPGITWANITVKIKHNTQPPAGKKH